MKILKILLNPKKWFQGVLIKKVIGKVAKHGAGALVAILSGPWFASNVQPYLDQLGVTIDKQSMEAGLIILIAGVLGGIQNWWKHRSISEGADPVQPEK